MTMTTQKAHALTHFWRPIDGWLQKKKKKKLLKIAKETAANIQKGAGRGNKNVRIFDNCKPKTKSRHVQHGLVHDRANPSAPPDLWQICGQPDNFPDRNLTRRSDPIRSIHRDSYITYRLPHSMDKLVAGLPR